MHSRRPFRLRPFAALKLAGCIACLVLCGPDASGRDVAKEYQIKAAFVFNFTKFVEWPPNRFRSDDAPIVIGVLGDNPFGSNLQEAVKGRKVGGRDVVVVEVTAQSYPETMHVLFVTAGQEKSFRPEKADGILTVGETERFNELGGMITFIFEAEKVRFVINLDRSEQAHLKMSAQLLKLASTVRRKP